LMNTKFLLARRNRYFTWRNQLGYLAPPGFMSPSVLLKNMIF
jgi:hypothetical protein